jgi:glutamate synthase (NADPH/NADH) small chain
MEEFDSICLTIGAEAPRDVPVEGRDLKGLHFAMEFLGQQNRVVSGKDVSENERITAANKHVIVLGGGDTGSDCIGTANRQGARSITQFEILPQFPEKRTEQEPWPLFARLHKTTSSHEEGVTREFSIATKKFSGPNGRVEKLTTVKVDWQVDDNGRHQMTEIPGSENEMDAELVLLAAGFVHPVHQGLVADLGVELDGRGNISVDENWMTSHEGVFSGGDSKRGASLVVWAMAEGREVANAVDRYLQD